MKKNRQIETMTCVQVGRYSVRVWRETTRFKTGPENEVIDALQNLSIAHRLEVTQRQIAATLDAMPGVAAYEILDWRRNGVIVYPDWK